MEDGNHGYRRGAVEVEDGNHGNRRWAVEVPGSGWKKVTRVNAG